MNWDHRERRQFVRIKFPCEITIPGKDTHTISAHTENISAGGMRAILGEKLPPSSIIDIDIYGITQEPIVCKGKIVWIFERKAFFSKGAFGFDTGIEFYQINEKDVNAIKELVASSLSKNKPTEK